MIHLPHSPLIARWEHQNKKTYIMFLMEKSATTDCFDKQYGKIVIKVYNEEEKKLLGKIFTNGCVVLDESERTLVEFVHSNWETVGKEIKKCQYYDNGSYFRYNWRWREELKYARCDGRGVQIKILKTLLFDFKPACKKFSISLNKLYNNRNNVKPSVSVSVCEAVKSSVNVDSVAKKTIKKTKTEWKALQSPKKTIMLIDYED